MTYIVEPLLYDASNKVVRGLQDGSLTRWGGVIRRSAGEPGAGRIVAHLRDLSPTMPPAYEVVGDLLQLRHVSAAASVLNLGVSVVGMVVLGYKIHKLQESMSQMFRVLDQNHRELSGKLDNIQANLVELKYLAIQGNHLMVQAIEETRKIRQDLFFDHLARLLSNHQMLAESSTSVTMLETILQSSRETRHAMSLALDAEPLDRRSPHRWPELLTRFRVWCFALSLEVAASRKLGQPKKSHEAAEKAAQLARRWLSTWTTALLPEPRFRGVHRFGFSKFESLPREVHERLWRIPVGTPTREIDHDEERLEAAYYVARELPSLPKNWLSEQVALAHMLDFLEETTERLESMSFEMEFCLQEGLSTRGWEELRAPSNTPLGLLVTSEA